MNWKPVMIGLLFVAFLFVVLGLFAITTAPHPKSTVVENTEPNIMHRVGGTTWADIYVVEIDGKKYIVVNGVHSAAICPAQ